MVSFTKKFYLFKVRETWFHYTYKFSDYFSFRQYSFIQAPEKISKTNCVKNISHTVLLPLHRSVEEIQSGFNSNVKRDVRQAEKEGVVCSFEDDKETFIPFFNAFAALKNIYPAQPEMINSIGSNFRTVFARLNGELLVAHSYIVDEEMGIARLFQSASKRLDENVDRKKIGIANKYLTAQVIFHFKEKGFKVLDFGGYAEGTTDKSLQGINEFKLTFGGEKSVCVNYYSPVYHLLQKIAAKLDRRY